MPFSSCRFVLRVLQHVRRFSIGHSRGSALFAGLALAAAFTGNPLRAQAPDRINAAIDPAHVQVLTGHRPAWALAANDAGAVSADLPLEHLTLVLARSPEQEAAFEQLLKDQQDPASPEYHHWLTPVEVGQRFGLSDGDLAALNGWLTAQGLHVNWVSSSRVFIVFGGTASSVGHAFQTELHNYKVNGELRMAPASDPLIPQAIAQAVKAVHGLFTIEDKPLSHAQTMWSDAPQMTGSSGSHYIAPGDFTVLYDLPSAWLGSGETIGIVGRSRTDFADFVNFQAKGAAAVPDPTEVVPTAYGGVDPGPAYTAPPAAGISIDDQGEATLDVLRAGSVAPEANLLLVVATKASGGIEVDAQYLVETTPVPAQIMNISFGSCESAAGASGVQFWDTLFQQAAVEGISVFVSSGDSGASGCDTHGDAPPASPSANSPNYICSSSYATCVGGTEFVDTSNPSQYWNSSNGAGYVSALSYIPEGAWNDPYNSNTSTYQVAASGGGVSSIIPTPSWQTGNGVPAARTGRYTPDIAFSASGHDGYFGCFAAGGGSCVVGSNGSFSFVGFSGTSAAAPGMAGITAMLDQMLGSAQGSFNPAIYNMAANSPSAFHDVTLATSGVGTCDVNTPSLCNNSIAGPSSLTGGQAGYMVTPGYDEVTGWGSLDVAKFLNDYAIAARITPTVTVTASPNPATTIQPVTVTITVSGGSGNPAPTGAFVFTTPGIPVQSGTLANGATTFSIGSDLLPAGTDTLAVTYTPDSSSSSVYNSASGTGTVVVTVVVQAPSEATGPTTSITASSATLNASVNPNYGDTQAWFLYGTSPTLSGASQTTSQDIGSGSISVKVSALVSGLSPSTTYYFEPVGQNSAGITYGPELSFTTPAPPPTSFAISGTAVSVSPGATAGNTSTITVAPSGGFTGTVTLSAAVTSSPPAAVNPPTFTWSPSNAQVTITGGGSQTATLVIATTAQSAPCYADGRTRPALPWSGGVAALACLILFGIPARRRRWRTLLGAALLCVFLTLTAVGCGGGSSSHACPALSVANTTPGSYTITITGTSGSTTQTGTVTLTVN